MKTTSEKDKVTVIGLGSMGAALAHALLKSGLDVTVWNRDRVKALPFTKAGASVAPDVSTALEASPVTIICVSNYKATASILHTSGATAALQNRTLIQLSTSTPKESRDLEAWALQNGTACLIVAILAWPSQIGGETTTILYSGAKNIYRQQEPLLKLLAGNALYMGAEAGAASALFASVLAYLAGSWIGFCHGALIAEKEGLRVDSLGVLLHNLSPVLGAELAHMGEVIQYSNFSNPESTVKTTGEDLHMVVQHALEAGINPELPKFAAGLFQRTIDKGYGQEEHAAIIKILRQEIS